jgi:hypothetical protein
MSTTTGTALLLLLASAHCGQAALTDFDEYDGYTSSTLTPANIVTTECAAIAGLTLHQQWACSACMDSHVECEKSTHWVFYFGSDSENRIEFSPGDLNSPSPSPWYRALDGSWDTYTDANCCSFAPCITSYPSQCPPSPPSPPSPPPPPPSPSPPDCSQHRNVVDGAATDETDTDGVYTTDHMEIFGCGNTVSNNSIGSDGDQQLIIIGSDNDIEVRTHAHACVVHAGRLRMTPRHAARTHLLSVARCVLAGGRALSF